MASQPAQRVYRTWTIDSTRWNSYRPRPDDIVIATYPKCGTTWMRRIVDLLVFQTPEPRSLSQVSPWIDRRFPEPLDAVMARIEAQAHRRFLKAHLPADGLPWHDEVRYIRVARDGRDAALSFHHFTSGFSEGMLAALDREGMADPAIGRPYPRLPEDPAEFFHRWLTQGAVPGQEDGSPSPSHFHCERGGGSGGGARTSCWSTTPTSRPTSRARCGGWRTISASPCRSRPGPCSSRPPASRRCAARARRS